MIRDLEPRKAGEPAKDYLARYIRWLAEHGDEVIGNYQGGALKDQDAFEMHFLQRSTEWLPSKYAELTDALDGRLEPAEAEHVYFLLSTLIASANHVGHHAMFSLSAAPRYQKLQGRRAGDAQRPKQKEKAQRLEEAIIAECESQGVEMEPTTKFGASIRLGVQKRLDREGETWPDRKTIASAILRILKARAKSFAHS